MVVSLGGSNKVVCWSIVKVVSVCSTPKAGIPFKCGLKNTPMLHKSDVPDPPMLYVASDDGLSKKSKTSD